MGNVRTIQRSTSDDIADAQRAAITAAISCIPEQTSGDVTNLVDSIMSAATPEDLDRPWRRDSVRDLVGVPLRIESVMRSPSTLDSAVGQFIVARGVRLDTGEPITFTTSATMVMIQLARAVQAGWLPLAARIVKAGEGRPGQSPPLRLEVIRPGNGGQSQSSDA